MSTEPFISLLCKSTPCNLGFFTASFYPIQPANPSFKLSLYLIPSPCNTSSSFLHSGPEPQSWSDTHPLFLHFSNQALFSCSLKSTQAGSHFSHHPDGSRRNEELFPYNCAVTSFLILQNLQKYMRTMTFSQGGQLLAGAAKGTCPRS